ncbi:MAG TPA: FAD-dependent monooxygenase [Pseudonocardiaceae bacterium]|jgi:2-polyprenyl-6-methoxyphenol hydroxylase-like FAD-dependent oxidoreductase|nr:FAD-dependent monooxygenase [Pseudonocardiaceae bacterium]
MGRTETEQRIETPVLVVGAGPVGAVLALELARHGVSSVLLDRSMTASQHPKMDYLNGRSMELLRRLDLADEIRSAGVAPEHSFNFIWSRDFDEPPIAVWEYASVAQLSERIARTRDGSLPAEAHQRLRGSLLEQVLRRRAEAEPLVDFRPGWKFEALNDNGDGVRALASDTVNRSMWTIDARFVIGCDGANSRVRANLGVQTQQLGPTTMHRDVYFRSADPVLRRHGRAFLTVAAGGLTLVSRDEQDTWTGTVYLADERVRADDPIALMRRNLGADFAVDEVLNITEWEGRLSVSDSYRFGSVFLAGDSAHQFYPTGGHGANTGVGDAVDLGWKLAAYLHGWGGRALLDSYQAERRPVALFNREMCGTLQEVWIRFPRLVAHGASRAHLAGFLAKESFQIDNLGVHFGYRYDSSPVVCHEDGEPPEWQWDRIVPGTWPGGRAPATRSADGTPVFDRLGPEFTLVDGSGAHVGKRLVEAAERRGVPMRYVVLDQDDERAVWERELVLVRPDQHVAWRGDDEPPRWDTVLDRVTGH